MSKATQSTVDISIFADRDKGYSRYILQQPHWIGGRLIATDGRVLAWLDDQPEQANPEGRFPNIEPFLSRVKRFDGLWKSLPPILAPHCANCGGEGTVEGGDCICPHCNDEHERVGGRCLVQHCDIELEGHCLGWTYVSDILKLPNVRYAFEDSKEDSPMLFLFDGGGGLLMPKARRAA